LCFATISCCIIINYTHQARYVFIIFLVFLIFWFESTNTKETKKKKKKKKKNLKKEVEIFIKKDEKKKN